ncbi:PREDICTED: translation initiation factor IF-2-like, partial [Chinchilla lanigera]|uniref:translation initiation factor IF-2-like n=1 Tax=Chinchilla lanigera TaxID=34839 RepID=UPI00069690B8
MVSRFPQLVEQEGSPFKSGPGGHPLTGLESSGTKTVSSRHKRCARSGERTVPSRQLRSRGRPSAAGPGQAQGPLSRPVTSTALTPRALRGPGREGGPTAGGFPQTTRPCPRAPARAPPGAPSPPPALGASPAAASRKDGAPTSVGTRRSAGPGAFSGPARAAGSRTACTRTSRGRPAGAAVGAGRGGSRAARSRSGCGAPGAQPGSPGAPPGPEQGRRRGREAPGPAPPGGERRR